ncbi:uncharacterized protein VTP21DRAFT_8846 [Calcarisporiella thermophila]|uniref:uncharacterized protein n=1 Tax=Calcarisporiella thermophila TaxID=911321 RepID=UPI0037440D06
MVSSIASLLLLFATLVTTSNASGYMVQSAMENRQILFLHWGGDIDVVAPATDCGLQHWWHVNNSPNTAAWNGPRYFGKSEGKFSGSVSLVNSAAGILDMVGCVGSELVHFTFEGGQWSIVSRFANDISGSPAMDEGMLNSGHRYDLVVPLSTGGIGHYYYGPLEHPRWTGPSEFGKYLGNVDAVTLAKKNQDSPPHLEVIARVGSILHHFQYDNTSWNYRGIIAAGVRGQLSLIQSSSGSVGKLEFVSPLQDGGLGYWYLDDSSIFKIWHGPKRFGDPILFDDVSLIQLTDTHDANMPRFPVVNVNLYTIARSKSRTKTYSRRYNGAWVSWNAPVL